MYVQKENTNFCQWIFHSWLPMANFIPWILLPTTNTIRPETVSCVFINKGAVKGTYFVSKCDVWSHNQNVWGLAALCESQCNEQPSTTKEKFLSGNSNRLIEQKMSNILLNLYSNRIYEKYFLTFLI